ncbi:LytTR family transcriptional regulator DNA-binding domain-containing protein [Bacteroidales bacterium OttesenSCG-928-E04]|nr:LytTR family transcriptional regulator DNA-binding domain-containing protein [Bacteroidales bacterium OttesenSCG-928-E04]MDL2326557.1 LytTR family transcriptional regulator DNA-binding domain-containing protein [Bacteroidales bacterium OttesenSCG-928-A14]
MFSCVVLVNDPSLEQSLIDCLSKFTSIEIVDILYNEVSTLERIYHLRPDILFVDVDDSAISNMDFAEIGAHAGLLFAITRHPENSYELLCNGFHDVSSPSDLAFDIFFRKMNKLLKFTYFCKSNANSKTIITGKGHHLRYKNGENEESMFARYNKTSIRIFFNEIVYIKNSNNTLEITMINGKTINHNGTMKKFLEILPHKLFTRINNATIINHGLIDKISQKKLTIAGEEFEVSKNYYNNLKAALNL